MTDSAVGCPNWPQRVLLTTTTMTTSDPVSAPPTWAAASAAIAYASVVRRKAVGNGEAGLRKLTHVGALASGEVEIEGRQLRQARYEGSRDVPGYTRGRGDHLSAGDARRLTTSTILVQILTEPLVGSLPCGSAGRRGYGDFAPRMDRTARSSRPGVARSVWLAVELADRAEREALAQAAVRHQENDQDRQPGSDCDRHQCGPIVAILSDLGGDQHA